MSRDLENNPSNFVQTYMDECSHSFTDLEKQYLKQTAENVQAMKQNRGASLLEKTRFEANFKMVLGGEELKGEGRRIGLR